MELREEGNMVGWMGQQNWHPVFLSTPIAIMAENLTNLFVLWSQKLWYNFNWFIGPMSQEVLSPPVWPPKVLDWWYIECALLLSLDAISSMVKCSVESSYAMILFASFKFNSAWGNSFFLTLPLQFCTNIGIVQSWVLGQNTVSLGSVWILLDWLG